MLRDTDGRAPQPFGEHVNDEPIDSAPPGMSLRHRMLSLIVTLGVAVLLAVGVRVTLAQAYVIPSGSMIGTLEIDDRVLAQRPLFDFNGINQGDIVVFDHPANLDNGQGNEFVKRVIATGTNTVEAHNGAVFVNGVALVEPYVVGTTRDFGPEMVPEGYLFVMGDNRQYSSDSRVFGTIPESTVNGTVFGRVWPLGRIGTVD